MSKRADLRARYIQGWYDMNAEDLLATTVEDFVFEDPAEPEPVTRDMLPDYMHRWDNWTRKLGADNRWALKNEVRQDKNSILTDWEWWELKDTEICGTAIVQTNDDGVLSELITYFDRNIRYPKT